MTAVRRGRRGIVLAGLAVVTLAAASTVTAAAVTGAFGDHGQGRAASRCAVPRLPGSVVSVRLIDMRSMMGREGMMGGHGRWMSQHDWRHFRAGMMRVVSVPTSVPDGVVSLRVTNAGYLTHELVVLPLREGRGVGTRGVGTDGKVSETGSLGEASADCAPGAGEGIAPGSTGWVTLRLPAGRYELLCNLPGHYAAGMYAELDVT